jgi:hypothetical protein
VIITVVTNTLKDFQKNQVTNCDNTFDNTRIERVCVPILNTIEVVDPDTGID